jgi:hypothetical protein
VRSRGATEAACAREANSPWLPPTPTSLSMLKWPQIQGVVVRIRRTSASPQLRLQLMRYAAGVQIALERSSAPLNGPRAQVLVGQRLCFDHGNDCDGEAGSQSGASRSSIQ